MSCRHVQLPRRRTLCTVGCSSLQCGQCQSSVGTSLRVPQTLNPIPITRQQEARVEREGGLADGDAPSPVRRKRIVLDVAVAREERCAGGEREEVVQPAAALKLHHHLWDDAGHHPHEEEQRRQLSRACHGDLSPQPNSYVTLFAKCCLLSPVQHCYNPAESIHGSFEEQNVMTFNYRTHYDSVSISAKETERVFTTPGCNIQTPVCWCEYAAGGARLPLFLATPPALRCWRWKRWQSSG